MDVNFSFLQRKGVASEAVLVSIAIPIGRGYNVVPS